MRYFLLSLLAVGFGALVLWPFGDRAETEENTASAREFTLSDSSEFSILHVRYVGGMTARRSSFNLFGDGRLLFKNADRAGETLQSGQIQLSPTETRSLLGLLVENGLADTSEEGIRRRMVELGRRGSVTDVGTMVVNFSLTSCSRGGSEMGPIDQTISMRGAKAMQLFYPEIEELDGLVALSERLEEYRRQMTADSSP